MSTQAELHPELGAGTHIVDFYRDDEELVTRVADHLAGALAIGGSVIAACTPDHRRMLEDALSARGFDMQAGAARRVARSARRSRDAGANHDRRRSRPGAIRCGHRSSGPVPVGPRSATPHLRRDGGSAVGRRKGDRGDRARDPVERPRHLRPFRSLLRLSERAGRPARASRRHRPCVRPAFVRHRTARTESHPPKALLQRQQQRSCTPGSSRPRSARPAWPAGSSSRYWPATTRSWSTTWSWPQASSPPTPWSTPDRSSS